VLKEFFFSETMHFANLICNFFLLIQNNQDYENSISQYDLSSLIIHHGSSNGGHYTAYARNHFDQEWYEYDDSFCRQVDALGVQNSQAYVLFYKKKNFLVDKIRDHLFAEFLPAAALAVKRETTSLARHSLLRPNYVSRHWLHRLKYFSEPGPISNVDFLCSHNFVYPYVWHKVDNLAVRCSQEVWNFLIAHFNTGDLDESQEEDNNNNNNDDDDISMDTQSSTLLCASNGHSEKTSERRGSMTATVSCTHLYPCRRCMVEEEAVCERQFRERTEFIRLREKWFAEQESSSLAGLKSTNKIYAINSTWFKKWEQFVKFEGSLVIYKIPGPVDNLPNASKTRGSTQADVVYHLNPSNLIFKC
jgi:hypothetical protein